MENEPIIQTLTSLFQGADERNWNKVRNSMATQLMLDYFSLSGNPAALLSVDKIVTGWQALLPGFDRTHHHLFDFKISRSGETTTIHCQGKADHFIGAGKWERGRNL